MSYGETFFLKFKFNCISNTNLTSEFWDFIEL